MANITYFIKHLGADQIGNGGGSPQGGGGGGGAGVANAKAIQRELEKGNKGQKKGLGATLGIKFGMASLLKQSQVFTGFVGTIFQLIGALVDVILAPFLPILIPGIRLIASLIPHVSKMSQQIYDFLERVVFKWFQSLPIPDWIKDNVSKALSAILVGVVMMKILGVWGIFKAIVSNFLAKPFWSLLTKMFPQIDTLMAKFAGKTFGQIIESASKAALRAIFGGWWDTLLLKIMLLTDFVAAPFKHLWTAIQTGFKAEGDSFVAAIVRKLWTNGIKLHFVDPILRRLTGIGALIKAPFLTLWKAITGDVATSGDGIIARAFKTLKGLPFIKTILDFPAALVRNINSLGKWFINLDVVAKVKALPNLLSRLFEWLPGALKSMIGNLPIVGTLSRWLGKELTGKIGGLLKGAKGLAGKALTRATALGDPGRALLAGVPGAGKVAALGSKLSPTALKNIAQGFKAIPVIGAVAEAGFGGWATYKDFKKYGAKAAAGRLALTVANTTAALFDPTGLASAAGSIGSNVAMDIAYAKMLDPQDSWKRANPDIWIEVTNPDGVSTFTKKQAQDNNDRVNASPSMAKDRTAMDGNPG